MVRLDAREQQQVGVGCRLDGFAPGEHDRALPGSRGKLPRSRDEELGRFGYARRLAAPTGHEDDE